ncbi:MAG: M48 family metalloprotease [Pseudomonadota bacterium]
MEATYDQVAEVNDLKPYRHEPTLFRIAMVFSVLFWLLLIVGTFGIALIYVALAFLTYLFVQSGFISYLRGNAVEVSESQYPKLYAYHLECCERLGMERVPRLYLFESDGVVNALAARFLNSHYVVLYATVVEALEQNPESLRFYLGHELCHVKRGHLRWSFLLWPARLMPVLGPALARAEETTCDFYGLACSDSPKDAVRAMAVMASGPSQWRHLNVAAFQDQTSETGGFWMSFHELTNTYPWLSKRVSRVIGASQGAHAEFPRRNPFAWVLSVFVPNIGIGGGAGLISMMVVVAIIGILAAVAIPAYYDYTARAKAASLMLPATQISQALATYVAEHDQLPPRLEDAGLSSGPMGAIIQRVELTESGFTLHLTGGAFSRKTLEFTGYYDEQRNLKWDCGAGTLERKYRPEPCRS